MFCSCERFHLFISFFFVFTTADTDMFRSIGTLSSVGSFQKIPLKCYVVACMTCTNFYGIFAET